MPKAGRKKARQLEAYGSSKERIPPLWKNDPLSREGRQTLEKRSRSLNIPDNVLLESFYQAMKEHVIGKIKPCLNKEDKLAKLKETLLKTKRLPRGIVPRGEEIARCAQNELTDFLNDATRSPVLNVVRFKTFVEEQFDAIVLEVMSNREGVPQAEPADAIMSEAAAEDSSIAGESTCEVDREIRTVTVTLNSILHSGLAPDMKTEVYSRFNDYLCKVSDYTSDFGLVVHSLMLAMRSIKFEKIGDSIDIQVCQGFSISSLFPMGFVPRSDIAVTASPIPADVAKSEIFHKECKELFGAGHLQFVDSEFFGARGAKKETADGHPVLNLLNNTVKPYVEGAIQCKGALPSVFRSIALEKYVTNLTNMWFGRTQVNKLLNKLLDVLLRIHLAPKREQKARDYAEKKKQEESEKKKSCLAGGEPMESGEWSRVTSMPFGNLSRDAKRDIIRSEFYKRSKYMKKYESGIGDSNKWSNKVKRSEEVITFFKLKMDEVKEMKKELRSRMKETMPGKLTKVTTELCEDGLHTEEQEEEELVQDDTVDLSRRRLGELKAIIKNVLFKYSSQELTEHDFLENNASMTAQEIQVCLPIASFIKAYIPSKENQYFIGYQLPFALFANDILRYAGYSKYCRNICPLSSATGLHALNLDSVSIYCMLTRSNEKPIMLFDFEGYPISSELEARTRKDAVFYSVFDLKKIYEVCADRKLEFGHYITLLPGLKLARIVGSRLVEGVAQVKDRFKDNNGSNNLPWHDIVPLQQKPNKLLKAEIAEQESQVKALLKQLKACYKKNKEVDFSKLISVAKTKWNKHDNNAVYSGIQDLKRQRYESDRSIQLIKKSISQARYEKFVRNKAIAFRNKAPQPTEQQKHIIAKREKYIGKAENMQLVSEEIGKDFTFCGTDNGIVTMTETVSFGADRFKYHLDLYNRYAPLMMDNMNVDVQNQQPPIFEPLPETIKVNSGDVDFRGGYWRQRKKLERDKRKTEIGKTVVKIQQLLSNSSKKPKNIENLVETHKEKNLYKNTLRQFYYSNKQVSIKKSVMLLNERARERLCSEERLIAQGVEKTKACQWKKPRKEIKGKEKKHLVMLVGDRGYGIGSRIKGHRRYGGTWKQDLHSKYTTVCITNEHKTSQTCVYCFSPLTHPKQRFFSGDKEVLRECRGAFKCINPLCVSVVMKKSVQSRDKVSAMAIGLSGLATLTYGETFPVFSPKCISQYNTNINSNNIPPSFYIASEGRAYSDAV